MHCIMIMYLIGLAVVVSPARAASHPAGCIWTDTNCACSPTKDVIGSQVCYDPIPPLVPTGQEQPCSSRVCNLSGKHTPYVCDCDGMSYCEIKSKTRTVLTPVGPRMCKSDSVSAKTILLLQNGTLPKPPGNCIFTDKECTCASSKEKKDCVDFEFHDATYGDTCRVRDCKNGQVCDCSGSATCTKTTVTKPIWTPTGNIPGQPGMVKCKQVTHTFVEVVPKVLAT